MTNFQKVTLLLTASMTVMAGATIAPSLPGIEKVFQDTKNIELLSRLVLTLPALIIAVAAPLAGNFIDRFGRMQVLYIGLIIYALGGSAGYFVESIYQLLGSRVVLGIGVSMVMTTSLTLVGDYLEGKERERFMGIRGATMSVSAMVYIGIGGLLADVNWRAPFLIYGSSLLVLLLVKKALWEPKNIEPTPSGIPTRVSRLHLFLFGIGLLGMMLFYLIPVQVPFLVSDMDIQSNALSGLAIVISTLGSITTSISYQKIRKKLSYEWVFVAAFTLLGGGYFVTYLTISYVMLCAGMFISGLGVGLMIPNISTWVLGITIPKIRGKVIGILSSCMFIGQFLSPIAISPFKSTYGLRNSFLAASVLAGALMLLFLFRAIINKKVKKPG